MPVVKVDLKDRSYPVTICSLAEKLGPLLKKQVKNGRVFVVWDAQFYALHSQVVKKAFRKNKIKTRDTLF